MLRLADGLPYRTHHDTCLVSYEDTYEGNIRLEMPSANRRPDLGPSVLPPRVHFPVQEDGTDTEYSKMGKKTE
jgi:hypothetical protein